MPEVETENLSMLTFLESPGDHRSIVFDITTRSLIGEFTPKVVFPVSRRLVTAQAGAVRTYNRLTQEKFNIHRITEQMDTVDKMKKKIADSWRPIGCKQ